MPVGDVHLRLFFLTNVIPSNAILAGTQSGYTGAIATESPTLSGYSSKTGVRVSL